MQEKDSKKQLKKGLSGVTQPHSIIRVAALMPCLCATSVVARTSSAGPIVPL